MNIITIDKLDMVFGPKPQMALKLLDQGLDRNAIKEKSNHVVGVQRVSLSIREGEIFVLMGLSGSGKSTLLRALNGLLPITRGSIELLVKDQEREYCYNLAEANAKLWRKIRTKHIAMVFQNFALLPWKSVLENAAFGLEMAHMNKEERLSRARSSLKAVGLAAWEKQYPHELSGGMKQRVGLARALATDAEILLMDEPFSALDPLIKSHLQQELLKLQRNLKKTIIFVTHDLDEALKIGNRIAIMHEGCVLQIGTPEEIAINPKNSFIKQFVANIDQTQLVRAKSIMTSLIELKRGHDSSILLDQSGHFRCMLDQEGRARRALCHEREGRVIPWTFFHSGSFNECDLIAGSEHLLLRDVIKAMGTTHRPLVIEDKSGKMLGAISPDAVLTALSGEG